MSCTRQRSRHLLPAMAWIALATTMAPASAGPILSVYSGDTTGGPVWNRPVDNDNDAPWFLSGFATAVPYHVHPFVVDVTGGYTVASLQAFDGYLFLYENSFDPAAPLVNILIGNDDSGPGCTAGAVMGNSCLPGGPPGGSVILTAFKDHFLVTTGWSDVEFGQFTNTISGPGNVSEIPEPGLSWLVATGLALLGLKRLNGHRADS